MDTISCGNALTGTTKNGIIDLYIKYSAQGGRYEFHQ
jgi:hypothetical protein